MRWFQNLFSPKPLSQGFLPEEDGHEIFYHEYGNPNGHPVIYFHGGPGGCSNARRHTRAFDLKTTRVILFDQRGCGRSRFKDLLHENTTQKTLSDAKRVLSALKFSNRSVGVAGNSWGSTLALLFAETFPKRVNRLILGSIFLARKEDNIWLTETSALFYPDILQTITRRLGCKNYARKTFQLLKSTRVSDHEKVLCSYGAYERLIGQLDPHLPQKAPEGALDAARVFFHYDINNYFIKENQILINTDTLRYIPTLIVHNRLDMLCPPKGAFDLESRLAKKHLIIVPEKGHGGPLMKKTLKQAVRNWDTLFTDTQKAKK